MIETVLILITSVLAIFGLAEFIHIIKYKLLSPKNSPKTRLWVYLKGSDAPLQLSSVIREYKWSGKRYANEIIAVYFGEDKNIYENCRRIAAQNNILFYGEK